MKTITYDETRFQLVPKEPTEKMLFKGSEASLDIKVLMDDTPFACERVMWRVMLENCEGI